MFTCLRILICYFLYVRNKSLGIKLRFSWLILFRRLSFENINFATKSIDAEHFFYSSNLEKPRRTIFSSVEDFLNSFLKNKGGQAGRVFLGSESIFTQSPKNDNSCSKSIFLLKNRFRTRNVIFWTLSKNALWAYKNPSRLTPLIFQKTC